MKDVLRWVVYVGVFVLPFIPLIVANSMFFPFITGKNFTFRIVVEIIFAAWVLLALLDAQYRPRFSWIIAAFAAFIAVIFLADVFGQYPLRSLWSNYERMEGWVTLAHLFAYFVVVGSTLTSEKLWKALFNVSLFVAVFISFYAMRQLMGDLAINQGGVRIDATLGNATYLAIYMLFHTFIALLMLVKSNVTWQRALYGVLAILFAYFLIQTATRGAILGLVGGLLVTTCYVAFFERKRKKMRVIAAGGLAAVVLVVGGFLAIKDTNFVREDPILSRIASISLEEGSTRFTIWGMAFEGFKERPILGWGQENFNYVFNKYYEPSLYAQEQWFDRVHNIFFDWLIAGGILGLGTYLALLLTTVYYVALRPLVKKDDTSFTVEERGLLLGLLAGYFFHNLFVFDNIVSYLLYATILAFVHVRVSTEIPRLVSKVIDRRVITQVVAPIVVVALVGVMYVVNVPGLRASSDLIGAFNSINTANQNQQLSTLEKNQLYTRGLETLERALTRGSFANQEIREQYVRVVQGVVTNPETSPEIRNQYQVRAAEELLKQIEEKPGDARVHVFAGSYFRFVQDFPSALEQLTRAHELSPHKQSILFEIGLIHLHQAEYTEAQEVFARAYTLAPEFDDARNLYAASAVYAEDWDLFEELVSPEHEKSFLEYRLGASTLFGTGNLSRLERMLTNVIAAEPENIQYRVSRAVVQHEMGDTSRAIQTVQETIELFPAFRAQGEQIIAGFLSGNGP